MRPHSVIEELQLRLGAFAQLNACSHVACRSSGTIPNFGSSLSVVAQFRNDIILRCRLTRIADSGFVHLMEPFSHATRPTMYVDITRVRALAYFVWRFAIIVPHPFCNLTSRSHLQQGPFFNFTTAQRRAAGCQCAHSAMSQGFTAIGLQFLIHLLRVPGLSFWTPVRRLHVEPHSFANFAVLIVIVHDVKSVSNQLIQHSITLICWVYASFSNMTWFAALLLLVPDFEESLGIFPNFGFAPVANQDIFAKSLCYHFCQFQDSPRPTWPTFCPYNIRVRALSCFAVLIVVIVRWWFCLLFYRISLQQSLNSTFAGASLSIARCRCAARVYHIRTSAIIFQFFSHILGMIGMYSLDQIQLFSYMLQILAPTVVHLCCESILLSEILIRSVFSSAKHFTLLATWWMLQPPHVLDRWCDGCCVSLGFL